MNKNTNYYSLSNFSDKGQDNLNNASPKGGGKGITEQSTPKEISKYISEKIVEFIEKELKTSSKGTPVENKIAV